MVHRRGRWLSLKVMSSYLREVAASTFMTDISEEARSLILLALESFPEALRQSAKIAEPNFPEKAWYVLSKHEPQGVASTGSDGQIGYRRPQYGAPPPHRASHAG